jgi:presqualene diphosphate synthase
MTPVTHTQPAAASVIAAPPPEALDITALVKASRSSFYWGMRVLRPERRRAMYALYAYCRILDDIADSPQPLADKRQALAFWHDELPRIAAGTARHPVGQALAAAVQDFGCEVTELAQILAGVSSDLTRPPQAQDWQHLHGYCRQVAGAVGRVAVAIFGDSSPAAQTFAGQLGMALQLTNIVRDVREDAGMGRIYLPREALMQAGIPPTISPPCLLQHPCLPLACRVAAATAAAQFAAARLTLKDCDSRRMVPARLMLERYECLLVTMQRGELPPRLRPRLGLWQQALLVGRYLPQVLRAA